jgi:hypothetical protein
MPLPIRERLIDTYCPAELIFSIKPNPPDADCLVRP